MGNYFIRIDDATDLRRKILESSKASLHVMRGSRQLVRIRSEKQTMLKALRRELKELTMLINRLEQLTPALSEAEMQEMQPKKPELPAILAPQPKVVRKAAKKAAPKKQMPLPELKERNVFVGMRAHKAVAKETPRELLLPAPAAPKPAVAPVADETGDMSDLEKLHSQLDTIERRLKGI
jgi:hypothetical protein